MRTRSRCLVLALLLGLAVALGTCGSSAPKQLTLASDAIFVEEVWTGDQLTIKPAGSVPAGAVCRFDGVVREISGVTPAAEVRDCTLEGVNYGQGVVYVRLFVESEMLMELLDEGG